MIRPTHRKLLYGVGVNDADYITQPKDRSNRCPFYDRWHSMIRRCYSSASMELNPTYEMTIVCQEWLTFSNFKGWMEQQVWEGMELDKDILGDGNLYSPKTCRFIPSALNTFFSERGSGINPLGARLRFTDGRSKPYVAQAVVDGKKKHLGVFSTMASAHRAWQVEKLKELRRLKSTLTRLDTAISSAVLFAELKLEEDILNGTETRSMK